MTFDPSRRSVLAATGAALAALSSGCLASGDSRELGHYVEIFNRDDREHTLAVRVSNGSDMSIYEREFTIGADMAREGTDAFTGEPRNISLTLDSGKPTKYQWPPNYCDKKDRISAGGVKLYIMPDQKLTINPSCDTVYIKRK